MAAASVDGPVLIANPGADLYGSDRMVLETVTALVSAGQRVIVTVPNEGPLIKELEIRGAEVVVTDTPIIRKAALSPRGMARLVLKTITAVRPGRKLLRRLRPSVLIVNTITPPLWLLLARVARVPAVCHVHEGEASVSHLLRVALAAPMLLADQLIVNSRFSRDVLVRAIGSLAGKSHVVYNAVPGPAEVVPPRAQLDEPIRLVLVGRLSARKGSDVAIEAVRILTERGVSVHLDLVGAVFPGYEWYERGLREAVSRYELEDRVSFHGFQPNVWPFLANADICLIPSTVDEPFGNTAVEAALAARPSVVSATSGLLEATDGINSAHRVEPGDPEQIATAVQSLAADWTATVKEAAEDALFARQRYSQQRYAADVNAIISRYVKSGATA